MLQEWRSYLLVVLTNHPGILYWIAAGVVCAILWDFLKIIAYLRYVSRQCAEQGHLWDWIMYTGSSTMKRGFLQCKRCGKISD